MKKPFYSSLIIGLFVCRSVFAQSTLLDASTLNQQETFTSLEKALEQPEKVYVLDLSGQSLRTLPPGIALLIHLQKLDLSDNQLREIPPALGQLNNLQWLDLYANQLSELPGFFAHFAYLQYLDLGGNWFSEIPEPVYSLPRLEHLYVYANKLTALSSKITQLDSLEYLRLGKGLKFFWGVTESGSCRRILANSRL
ncbi:MAG: leucine-rich repeat domain-containing protein [Bacteroidia bacterium]|nr:leucine-rich repeat domain-containing protein [Bacteroidia bacterium]